jgi:hypothetical protein
MNFKHTTPFFLGLVLMAGCTAWGAPPKPAPAKAKVVQDLKFTPVDIQSTRYPDQVGGAGKDIMIDYDRALGAIVKGETIPEVTGKFTARLNDAMAELGFVPRTTADINRLPTAESIAIFSFFMQTRSERKAMFWFTPKDQETFEKYLPEVDFLGDRRVGKMNYSVRNLALALSVAKGGFADSGCEFQGEMQIITGGTSTPTVGAMSPSDFQGQDQNTHRLAHDLIKKLRQSMDQE